MLGPSFRLLALFLLLVASVGCQSTSDIEHVQAVTEDVTTVHASYVNKYGITTDSLWAYGGTIEYGETLSDILGQFDVGGQRIASLREAASGVFDLRRLRAGHSYRVYQTQSKQANVRYFVYELDRISYVVFDLTDSIDVTVKQRPVKTVNRAVAGVINSSLYNSLQDAGASIELALKMAEVYAWQVDFYGIQQGDRFKVIYEQEQVDGEPVGVGKILGAYFQHHGADYYAIRFNQDKQPDYFDHEGHSLRKAFLKTPLKFSRISSRFSRRRLHPVQNRYKAHLGTDYAAPRGTPIYASGDGTVTAASYSRYNGRYVKIRHNSTYTSGYLHMSRIADGMRPGKHVKQGQVIGYVGSTGLATGPHLHYSFWKNGKAIDHLKIEMPPSEPVKDEYQKAFDKRKKTMLQALGKISYPENRQLTGALALEL